MRSLYVAVLQPTGRFVQLACWRRGATKAMGLTEEVMCGYHHQEPECKCMRPVILDALARVIARCPFPAPGLEPAARYVRTLLHGGHTPSDGWLMLYARTHRYLLLLLSPHPLPAAGLCATACKRHAAAISSLLFTGSFGLHLWSTSRCRQEPRSEPLILTKVPAEPPWSWLYADVMGAVEGRAPCMPHDDGSLHLRFRGSHCLGDIMACLYSSPSTWFVVVASSLPTRSIPLALLSFFPWLSPYIAKPSVTSHSQSMHVVAFIHGDGCEECVEALRLLELYAVSGEVHDLTKNGDMVCELCARLQRQGQHTTSLRLPQIFRIDGNREQHIGGTSALARYLQGGNQSQKPGFSSGPPS